MKVVCPDGIPEYKEMIEPMISNAGSYISQFKWFDGRPSGDSEFVKRIGEAEAVILMWSIPDDALTMCPNLKIISFAGVGAVKFINIKLASAKKIIVCNTPGYGDNAVAEHAIALIFAVARKIASLDRNLRKGEWIQPLVMELRGKTLGLIGLGGIGTKVAELGKQLGLQVICWTRNPSPTRAEETGVKFVSFDQLFRESDIISIHIKHVPETEKLVSKKELLMMKKGSILINTARGEIVDTPSLLEVLQNGPLGGAGLDVFDQEPLPKEHPLYLLDSVTLTSHVGYNTPEATLNLLQMTVDNVVAYKKGNPCNVVNPEALK